MVTETIPQLDTLSPAQKRRLIVELIDEVYGEPVRERELKTALVKRIAHAQRNPDTVQSWSAVKARLRGVQ